MSNVKFNIQDSILDLRLGIPLVQNILILKVPLQYKIYGIQESCILEIQINPESEDYNEIKKKFFDTSNDEPILKLDISDLMQYPSLVREIENHFHKVVHDRYRDDFN
jgi:hypothetical protein